MPVTIHINANAPGKRRCTKAESSEQLLERSCEDEYKKCSKLLQSSFSTSMFQDNHITPSQNGFVLSMISAYSSHHPITLRPEDVWFAILSQLGFYINSHAEEVRPFFVAHSDKKELVVNSFGTAETVDFGRIAQQMTDEIHKNVVDPELRDWFMPAFSTTTDSDLTVAAILLMGSLQAFFSYRSMLACGMPSVTLLGERADWDLIYRRLDKIARLGDEPATFMALLKPVLKRFTDSFDDPTALDLISFWARAVDRHEGSGMDYCTGWISAFCMWNTEGGCLREGQPGARALQLDGVLYHRANISDIPTGFMGVPMVVNDNGNEFPARMVAGSVAIKVSIAPEVPAVILKEIAARKALLDKANNRSVDAFTAYMMGRQEKVTSPGSAIEPVTGWWMFATKE